MIKKIICTVVSVCLLIGINVSAENAFSITPKGNFISYKIGGNMDKIAEVMGLTNEDFESLCDSKNIIYFAVNSGKTKQIQLTCNETGFSNGVTNLSNISDDGIRALMSDLTGDENIRGEIIQKDGQKFIKTQLSSRDSGGEYTVTEYITVAGKLNYTLSFFTSESTDTDYIEKTFETYNTKDFNSEKTSGSLIKYILHIAIGIFILTSIFIVFTLIRDIRKSDDEKEDEQPDDEKNLFEDR